ncbi:ABC transporter permease [Jiella flava]|uniref:ABC transporter permease n=1 Tax=Jiella flava TaxID=2816857 RepID=A0A939JUE7_9HYPH|nr:ABC transporter permease [Jiella flava]MBO0661339.1 ABC transporter permease [Jiella flava]
MGASVVLSKFIIQGRVIYALVIRELMSRYGRENIGFLWYVGEPVFLIGGVIILWSIRRGESVHHMPIVGFALTGYSMLTLWRHMIGFGIRSMRVNGGLLFHQNVKIIDTIIANVIMEALGIMTSFLVCFTILYIFNLVNMIYDPLLMCTAYALMVFFNMGVLMFVGALCEQFDAADRLMQPIMYFSLPVSGAFSLVSWLPARAQELLLYFPMVHASEMFRAGFYGNEFVFHYDPIYLVICGIVSNALGITYLKYAEKHMAV